MGNSSESSAEEVIDIDEIIAKNLNSPNGLVVMFTIAKLIKIMKPYVLEGQLSYFDKNLFNSFYSSKSLEAKDENNKSGLVVANPTDKKQTPNDS